ncbi:hypothetical protein FSP39_014204 [Pinctada imbricata]|uniref:J domain-containing protein n=1 Tax=Pinctada imbricata TaxID=66713 RepID=A0AA89BUP9_PINIB|nr:hypothetical protein FSP39_014204 [Pinctada imbricata]
MRKKYEENQRRDRENYNIHKKKVYTEKWSKLLKSNEDDILTYSDIPWPFKKEISEMKTLLFCDIDVKSDDYRKYLRELQKQWHPDKFVQKLGHRLKPEEREEILNKVKEISQELNKWSESSME